MKIIPFLLCSLVAVPAFAQSLSGVVPLTQIDALVAKAQEAEANGAHAKAADIYMQAATFDPELSTFLRFRATQALLALDSPPLERLHRLSDGLASTAIAGAALARVRVEEHANGGLATAETLETALKGEDREAICERLTATLSAKEGKEGVEAPVVDLHHGFCSDTEVESLAPKFAVAVSPLARVRRAERLNGQVRFFATVAEIDELGDVTALPFELACRAQFVKGRSLYRIRKRRSESDDAYGWVAQNCTQDSVKSLRKRALYALGKRRWDLDDVSGTKTHFEQLLADFGDTSHADDAVFYLARVARAQGDRARELELLALAAERFSDGDMFAETIWEVFESLYRDGKYAEFIAAVEGVPRPERDDQYFSQGRLEYFIGQSHRALKDDASAITAFREAWVKYPWSFYGYLSRMRLVALGSPPPPVKVDTAGVPPWLDDIAWRASGIGRLNALALQELAASYAQTVRPKTPADRWRVAYTYDRAGHYPVSHNIVRRQIEGRPWTEPYEARLLQWQLAWPDPFGSLVDEAVAAETEQASKEWVAGALPRSIMREESSFIPEIESYAGALGLMQLMPRTALGHDDDIEGDATPERLVDPALNVRVGVDHLFWLGKRWEGNPILIVASYNAGSGAVSKWLARHGNEDPALFIEDIPALQTRDYTKRVIGSYAAYQYLAGGERFDDRVLRPVTR